MFQFPSCPPSYDGDGSLHPPGCPIRKSVDLSLLAAPYRVSPLGTSFFGTPPLGIPQKPCLSLETVSPHTNSLLPPRQAYPPRRSPFPRKGKHPALKRTDGLKS